MLMLFLKAYIELVRFDVLLARASFEDLYRRVHDFPIDCRSYPPPAPEEISRAINLACICYRRNVLCLQRSAATVCLLKAHGIPAKMILGARLVPFKAHAWVEVDGRVVNDKPDVAEIYSVLDRG